MIKRAMLAFLITFCAPWAIISAYKTYTATGHKIGQVIYAAVHE